MAPIYDSERRRPSSLRHDELRETGDLHEKVWELETRLEKQAVTIEALFALLTTSGVSADALTAEVRRVERDRAQASKKTCAKCGHALGRRHLACVYCGQARVVESPFELL